MKKMFSTILLAILFQVAPAQAGLFDQGCCDYNDCCPSNSCCCDSGMGDITLAAKFAAWFPLEKRARKIYHDAFPGVEIEAATTWCNWQPWVNVGYVWSRGRSIGCSEKTRLSLIPLTFGVNYLFPMCNCIDAYVGAGAAYSWLRTRDHSEFVSERVHKEAWGGVAKLGFYYNYSECIFFEGFVNYFYTRFRFRDSDDDVFFVERRNVNLSALKVGVGVGFKF